MREPNFYVFVVVRDERKFLGIPRRATMFITLFQMKFSLGWIWFYRDFDFMITLADHVLGKPAVQVAISIPHILSLHFVHENAYWPLSLPGVTWNPNQNILKDGATGERLLGLESHHDLLWWHLWVSPNHDGGIRKGRINFLDLLLGPVESKRTSGYTRDMEIEMPEGTYLAKIKKCNIESKRKRWHKKQIKTSVDISVECGVPIPGKGESGHDMDDDALFSAAYVDEGMTLNRAVDSLVLSVMRDREKHGGKRWVPNDGWPSEMSAKR